MRLLRTDRRVQAMTGIDQRVFRQREQTCPNAFDDLWKVAYRRFRVTGSARKEGVAAEKMLADQEARAARGVTGCVHSDDLMASKFELVAFCDREVWRRGKHVAIDLTNTTGNTECLADWIKRLVVVLVPVRRQHLEHIKP